MVLHHRVEPAQVVGGAGWADVMAMAGVAAMPLALGSCSRGGLMVLVVVSMALVGIALGQGRGGHDPGKQERCSKGRHG